MELMQFGTLKMLMAQQLRAENDLQVVRFPARVRILVRPCTRGASGAPLGGRRATEGQEGRYWEEG